MPSTKKRIAKWLVAFAVILAAGFVAWFTLWSRKFPNRAGGKQSYFLSRIIYLRDLLTNSPAVDAEVWDAYRESLRRISDNKCSYGDFRMTLTWKQMYGSTKERIAYGEQAIKRFPFDPRCYALLADVYVDLNDFEAAREAMERCPHRTGIYYKCFVGVLERSGDLQAAYRACRKGIAVLQKERDQYVTLLNEYGDAASSPSLFRYQMSEKIAEAEENIAILTSEMERLWPESKE